MLRNNIPQAFLGALGLAGQSSLGRLMRVQSNGSWGRMSIGPCSQDSQLGAQVVLTEVTHGFSMWLGLLMDLQLGSKSQHARRQEKEAVRSVKNYAWHWHKVTSATFSQSSSRRAGQVARYGEILSASRWGVWQGHSL